MISDNGWLIVSVIEGEFEGFMWRTLYFVTSFWGKYKETREFVSEVG